VVHSSMLATRILMQHRLVHSGMLFGWFTYSILLAADACLLCMAQPFLCICYGCGPSVGPHSKLYCSALTLAPSCSNLEPSVVTKLL
jgi:hypothetical protein